MEIRDYRESDYGQVVQLLAACRVDPPAEPDELAHPCVVAEDDGAIVGVVGAIAGKSSKAYADYLAVSPRRRDEPLFVLLMLALEKRLMEMGVKRYVFHVEKWNTPFIKQLHRYRQKYRITMLNDLHYFSKEIS